MPVRIRPDIAALPPIDVPGEPPAIMATRYGLPPERIIKLDANENPFGPSPLVRSAIERLDVSFYPDPAQMAVRQALAGYAGVDPTQVVVTNGGDELITMLMLLTLAPGDEMIDLEPSFGMYAWAASTAQGAVVIVPRRRPAGWSIDVDAILQAITPRTRLVMLCNPNNPTGNLTPQADIERLLAADLLVVVDEAYFEFSGETVVPLLSHYSNLMILRTMSKWAGLAGLRIGYCLTSGELAGELEKLRQPFNVNVVAQAATVASIEDKEYLLAGVQRLVAERPRLEEGLRRLPFLTVYPSRGNFVLCEVSGVDVAVLKEAILREGLIIRIFQKPELPNALRISVGRPEQNEAALAILERAGKRLGLL